MRKLKIKATLCFCRLPARTTADKIVGVDQLTADQVAAKINHMPRGRVPIAGNHRTAFIDVQGKPLLCVVANWEDNFTGYVVDCGSYSDQQRGYLTHRDARHMLSTSSERTGPNGSVYAGLDSLTDHPHPRRNA
jgi:hypothetical protein